MKFSKASAYSLHALMYMVRHITQLPTQAATIANAEGIPGDYLTKLLSPLVKAGLIKAVTRPRRGYVFAKSPKTINLRELFELTEGVPLFEDCFLRHCDCNGTPQNCQVYALWHDLTSKMLRTLEQTSLEDATWNHPEHGFLEKPKPVKSDS